MSASRLLFLFAITAIFSLLRPAIAAAECAAPTSPGVRICSPTSNATLVWIPSIDFNSTPSFGMEIVKVIAYDNNRKLVEITDGRTGTAWEDDFGDNGPHRVVVNAWDSSGKLYQASVSFNVVGLGYNTNCAAPWSPGINFCAPPTSGVVLPTNYWISATARGQARITNIRVYFDNKAQFTFPNVPNLSTTLDVGTQGNHKVTYVAWDSLGNAYSSSKIIKSTYTYGFLDCPPKGNDPCKPGFDPSTIPQANAYVGNSFPISVSIDQPSHQITTMKAYIDNTLGATSNGPTMTSTISQAPNGTHILTLQAWDTTGVIYRVQYNININVPH